MKYKLTEEKIQTPLGELVRIEALSYFSNVKKGEKGGFIMLEKNLSQSGNAWVYGNAQVWFDAKDVKYLCAGPFGRSFRYITITKSEVRAGCFYGNLDQFKIAVRDKYGEGFGSYSDAIIICESFMDKTA